MLPTFNDTIAVAPPLYTCSAVAGAAIQATVPTTVRYARSVKVLPLLPTAGLPSSAEPPQLTGLLPTRLLRLHLPSDLSRLVLAKPTHPRQLGI